MSAESRWWAAVHEYEHTRFWRPWKLWRLRREASTAMGLWCADNERRNPAPYEYMRRWWEEHAA